MNIYVFFKLVPFLVYKIVVVITRLVGRERLRLTIESNRIKDPSIDRYESTYTNYM